MNMHVVSCIFVMFDLFASNLHKPYNIDLERERSARAAIPPKKKTVKIKLNLELAELTSKAQ